MPKWQRQVGGQSAVPQLCSSLGSMVKKSNTARPRDTRILGPEKNRAAQNRTS